MKLMISILDLIPSSHIEEVNAEFHREARLDIILKDKLKDLELMDIDFVIIDCGPQRTRINDAVLCYVDKIIMPVQVEAASVRAVGNIYDHLADLRLDPQIDSTIKIDDISLSSGIGKSELVDAPEGYLPVTEMRELEMVEPKTLEIDGPKTAVQGLN